LPLSLIAKQAKGNILQAGFQGDDKKSRVLVGYLYLKIALILWSQINIFQEWILYRRWDKGPVRIICGDCPRRIRRPGDL